MCFQCVCLLVITALNGLFHSLSYSWFAPSSTSTRMLKLTINWWLLSVKKALIRFMLSVTNNSFFSHYTKGIIARPHLLHLHLNGIVIHSVKKRDAKINFGIFQSYQSQLIFVFFAYRINRFQPLCLLPASRADQALGRRCHGVSLSLTGDQHKIRSDQ